MLHIVDQSNRIFYEDKIEEMFRQRHEIFVEWRGWKELDRGDGREVDQFDDDRAIYMMMIDGQDNLMSSVRFRPTDDTSMLEEIFPYLCTSRPIPKSERIWEITRLYVAPDYLRTDQSRSIMNSMLLGEMEFAVLNNMEAIVCVVDTFFLPGADAICYPNEPMGLPRPYDEGVALACYCPVTMNALADMRKAIDVPPVPTVGYFNGPTQLPHVA